MLYRYSSLVAGLVGAYFLSQKLVWLESQKLAADTLSGIVVLPYAGRTIMS